MNDDASYLWGDGVFETMRISEGRVLSLERHLARMARTLAFLGYPLDIIDQIRGELGQREPIEAGLMRVTVSREDGPLLKTARNITYRTRPIPPVRAIRLGVARGWYLPDDLLAEHKTSSYLRRIEVRRRALGLGFDDALTVSRDGRIGEASMANVFAYIDDVWVTPNLEGVLPGTTRARIMERCAEAEVDAVERPLYLSELQDAQAICLTSAGVGVAPVMALEDRVYESVNLANQLAELIEDFE